MHKNRSGFTIVELLIVIVVVGILAAITIVAYNGVQQRTRDAKRTNDIAAIQKSLEAYRVINDTYPASLGPGTNVPSDFTSSYGTTSYAYSVATDDSWLKALRTSGVVSNLPKDPINDGSHYYIYLAYGPNGTAACNGPFYVLIAHGWEGGASTMPASARTLTCTNGTTVAAWNKTSTDAVFSNTTTPGP